MAPTAQPVCAPEYAVPAKYPHDSARFGSGTQYFTSQIVLVSSSQFVLSGLTTGFKVNILQMDALPNRICQVLTRKVDIRLSRNT